MVSQRSRPIDLSAILRRRAGVACVIAFTGLAGVAYTWAALDSPGALLPRSPASVLVLTGVVLTALLRPFWSAYAVFVTLPLFGNHPGGYGLELLNVVLAASIVGLAAHAWRRSHPPPRGHLWMAAAAYLFSAMLATVPTIGAMAERWLAISHPSGALTHALTAPETDPLYSLQSLILVALAVAWAGTLAWAAPGVAFARNVLRIVAVVLFLVLLLGALDLHGVIDLERDYLLRIDDRSINNGGLRAIFWNPGWFAWYFTMAFGLVIGLLWIEPRGPRILLGASLAVSYLYFLANRQRGGFVALHAVLAAALATRPDLLHRRRVAWGVAGALGVLVVVVLAAFDAVSLPEPWFSAIKRLTTWSPDSVRTYLAVAAWRMWQSGPVFGAGEGSFAWRYRDYIPVGSIWETETWGDAHNTWLQILATRGVVGLAVYGWLLAVLIVQLVSTARAGGRERRGVALGLLFSLLAFLVYSFVQYMFYLQAIQVFFWGIVALASVIASPREEEAGSTPARDRSLRGGGGLTAAALAAMVVQVGAYWPMVRGSAAELTRQPSGFYAIEQPHEGEPLIRWSRRRGTLCVYPTAPLMTMRMLIVDPSVRIQPLTLSVMAHDRLLERIELERPGSLDRSLYLVEAAAVHRGGAPVRFGECLGEFQPLRLGVHVSRTWSPFRAGMSEDRRELGVLLVEPSYTDAGSFVESGLFAIEMIDGQPTRWTGARASMAVTVPAESAVLTLPLRATHPDLQRKPVQVTAFWNAAPLSSLTLRKPQWYDLRLPIGDAARRGIVTLQVSRVWQPKASGEGSDTRYLGVQIQPLRLE